MLSIVISSYNRLALLRRTLWSIQQNPPEGPYEVVISDESSTEPVFDLLKEFSFPWTFISVNMEKFTEQTGLEKYHNNGSLTANVGVKHAKGDFIVHQGNEVMATPGCYRALQGAAETKGALPFLLMSTTYDVPLSVLDKLDQYGTNLTPFHVSECERFPLQSTSYQSLVTNYLCLSPRSLWDRLGGYDERYVAGIGAEDSDFVRRARTLPGFTLDVLPCMSLHQNHRGRTKYYFPPPSVITKERWDTGVAINRVFYDCWRGQTKSGHDWPWGELGVTKVERK